MVLATNLWQAMACNFCHARLSHQEPGFARGGLYVRHPSDTQLLLTAPASYCRHAQALSGRTIANDPGRRGEMQWKAKAVVKIVCWFARRKVATKPLLSSWYAPTIKPF